MRKTFNNTLTKFDSKFEKMDSSGTTLMELIVYLGLSAIFLGIGFTIFANIWPTTSDIWATGTEISSNQKLSTDLNASIKRSVKNDWKIENVDNGQVFSNIEEDLNGNYQCSYWAVMTDNTEGGIWHKTSDSQIDIDFNDFKTGFANNDGWTQYYKGYMNHVLPQDNYFSEGMNNFITYGFKLGNNNKSLVSTNVVQAQGSDSGGLPTCFTED